MCGHRLLLRRRIRCSRRWWRGRPLPARDRFALEVGQPQSPASGQAVRGGEDGQSRLDHECLGIEPLTVERAAQQCYVGTAVPQHGDRLSAAADDNFRRRQMRTRFPVGGEDLPQQPGIASRFDRHDELGCRLTGPACSPGRRVHRVDRDPGLVEQHLTGVGQPHLPGGALQQAYPEPGFHLSDRLRQRGCAIPRRCAARLKFSSSATAMKYLSSRTSSSLISVDYRSRVFWSFPAARG